MAYDIPLGSASIPLLFVMIDSSDHITGKTGLTPTVTIRKPAGAFATPSGAVSEIANGWYQVAGNATDTNTLGPIALHATSAGADPTDVVVANVRGFPGIRKNIALPSFEIIMTDSTNHVPAIGKTVTVTRSIDHGAFAALSAPTVTELSAGTYYFDLAASDLNGDIIMLRATATGCDDLFLLIRTNP
jgi:hypothetical protein